MIFECTFQFVVNFDVKLGDVVDSAAPAVGELLYRHYKLYMQKCLIGLLSGNG